MRFRGPVLVSNHGWTGLGLVLSLLVYGCSSGSNDQRTAVAPGTEPGTIGSAYDIDFPERLLDRRAAARLLSRASFGATDEDIDEGVALGTEEAWIDAQMAKPATLNLPYTQANSNGSNAAVRHHAWWIGVMEGEDQLRQRVAFALSEIFVVSDRDYTLSNSQYGMASFRDLLSRRAFGNYRELLEAVTLHPVMGIYLSMIRNEKADPDRRIRPDENYAREIMQLFSIGLHRLDDAGRPEPMGNPVPAYTQQTVENLARVFTGWNFANTDEWYSSDMTSFDKVTAMVPVEQYHDREAKVLLLGERLPAGMDARADLERALDNIAAHPNVGPFISRRLIERLVTSNPSPDYVQRVAAVFNDDGTGERGDLGATIRAILADDEAWQERESNPNFGKLKEPVFRLSNLMRALNATPGSDAGGQYNSATRTADRTDEVYGQSIMTSPSVFNFFQPDNPLTSRVRDADGSTLVAPEAQIFSESAIASVNNDLHVLINEHHSRAGVRGARVILDIEEPLRLLAQGAGVWVDWLEEVLMGGRMSAGMRDVLLDHLEVGGDEVAISPVDEAVAIDQVLDTLYLVVASPEYLVQ